MTTQAASPAQNRLFTAALAGGLLALVGCVAVYLIAGALNVPVEAPLPPDNVVTPIPIFAVVFATLVPAVAAAVLYYLLNRFSRSGRTLFLAVAVLFLLFSFGPLVTMPETVAVSTRLVLGLMHVIAGGAIIGALLRYHPRQA